jgi:nicotinamide mononucleotide transporter
MKKYLPSLLILLGSVVLIGLSYFKLAPMSLVEVFGFISGAICVWLVAKDNIWNWPIGIINAAFYVIVFYQARLFADMSLQVVYIILGFLGWFMWLKGGENMSKLDIRKVGALEFCLLTIVGIISTYFMFRHLVVINDSAPFLDALTTVVSLMAQYLLTRKFIENWYLWLTVDVIYVGLFFSRQLYLTSVLYAIFFAMCLIGLKEWREKKVSNQALAMRGSDV